MKHIRQLAFEHRAKPTVGIEVFRLQQLFARVDSGELPLELELPQRPTFHIVFVGIVGAGTMVVDFRPVPIGARRLGFIAAGRIRQFVFERAVDAWMVLIEPSVALGIGTNVLSPAWEEPWLEPTKAEHAELRAIVEQIAAEQERPLDAYQPELLSSLVRTLLLRCERLHGGAPSPHELAKFFSVLERDFAGSRSVEHYAREVGFSPRRLGELLVAHTGRSTKQLIADRVLLELKRALAFTEVTVKQLAADTGFDEPTNLVKFFRLHTKLTPLEFREKQRTFLPSARGSTPSSGNRR